MILEIVRESILQHPFEPEIRQQSRQGTHTVALWEADSNISSYCGRIPP